MVIKRMEMAFLGTFIVFMAMITPSFAVGYPNPIHTPGKTHPKLDKKTICDPSFRTGIYRHVTDKNRKKAFELYGIDYKRHADYELDHLIPLTVGGSNDLANLWPEPYLPRPGAHEKDKVEVWLHKKVCQEEISLEEAQKEIVEDWYKVYKEWLKR